MHAAFKLRSVLVRREATAFGDARKQRRLHAKVRSPPSRRPECRVSHRKLRLATEDLKADLLRGLQGCFCDEGSGVGRHKLGLPRQQEAAGITR